MKHEQAGGGADGLGVNIRSDNILIIKTDGLYTFQIDCRSGCADAVDDVRGALHLGDQQRLQQSKHRPCKLWQ